MRQRYLLFTILLLLSVLQGKAQTDIAIGTGTTGNGNLDYPCPLQDFYEGSRSQYLYRASELTAAGMGPGMINAVKFNVLALASSANPYFDLQEHTIKIGTTAAASLTPATWDPSPMTTVYTNVSYLPVLGINSFTCSPTFFWNGTDNIIVEICNGGAQNDTATMYTGNPTIPWTTSLPFNASNTYRVDNAGNLCATPFTNNSGSNTTRPNIIFNWTAAAACTGIPTPGTASASASAVCLNESFNLKLTGTSVASGLTYQWEASTDNITFTPIAGATTAFFTTSQSGSTYYRCQVTCSSTGGGAAASNSVLVTSPTLVSGIFTIDKNAALPLPANTFNTFNQAYEFIKCGINGPVVFNVAAASGPYTEQLIMTPVPGASATNTVTFNGNGNTLTFAPTSNERAVIKLNGADHIAFDSLVITATGTTYGYGVQLLNNADSNAVTRCQINTSTSSTSDAFGGIIINNSATSATTTGNTNCDYNNFTGNSITGGYYGITLVASTTNANIGNKFINNKITDFYYYGMYVYGSSLTNILGNTVSRPTRTNHGSSGYGFYISQTNLVLNLTRNIITNPFGGALNSTNTFYGIYMTDVDAFPQTENIISNNLLYNFTGSGSVYGIYNSSSDNAFYYHNTIVLDGAAPSGGTSHVARGFYQTSQAAGVDFRNNIIVISRGGPGPKHAIYFNATNSTILSNRNDLYISSSTGARFIGYNGSNRATLADWQAGAAQDANSVSTNPVFADPVGGNYTPTSASVNDLGFPVTIPIDLYGNARSTVTPDIGCIEFTPPPCLVPPTAGVSAASHTPVCALSGVQLSVSGNSVGLLQTYQWEVGATASGPFTAVGNVMNIPDTSIIISATGYYRCAITCSGNTAYSTPVLIEVTPRLAGGNYTIGGSGANNYASFAAAREAMKCGIAGPVVFDVVSATGPYNEQLILDSIPGTSAINTITFNGNGNTIKFSSTSSTERAVIKLRGTDFVTIDSLVIDATGSGSYGYGVQLVANADSNTIKNCRIITSPTSSSFDSYAGVVINASEEGTTTSGQTLCDGNTIHHNTIDGGYNSVTLIGGTPLIKGNKITQNTITNFYNYGIYMYYTDGTVIEKNDISRPTRTSVSYCYAIYANSTNNSLLVNKNRVHRPFGGAPTSTSGFYGIYLSDVNGTALAPINITNNLIYDLNGNGDFYGLYNYNSDHTHYYHNTVSMDDQNSTHSSSYWTRGFYQTGDADGIDFRNNLITITRTGAGTRHGIYMSATATTYTSDYNDIYVTSPSGNNGYVGYSGGNRTTLADWQTATTQDAHSISMDPVYADPLILYDFTPVVSPLDNGGTPVGVGSDIKDVIRSTTTPDIGAYEFAIPPCTQPPVAGAAEALPNSGICLGTTIKLTLTGNTTGGTQTYQWQAAAGAAGPWNNISEVRFVKEYSTELTFNNFFRCKVVCGGDTAYSTPVQVVMNPALLAGVYTIDPNAPTGTPNNYPSFITAVAALECGITGAVTFNVAAGTYTEQVRMHKVAGASDTSRITFQSANGDATSVTLTANGSSTRNYVLQLDSASFITYKDLTLVATNTSYGRVVELANTAGRDSIVNCIVTGVTTTSTSNNLAVIYADNLKGVNNTIRGNTISKGSNGVHFEGEFGQQINRVHIDSNTISGTYQHGIYAYYVNRLHANKNTIKLTAPITSDASGIYTYETDSAYQFNHNKITISATGGTKRGMYIQYGDAISAEPGEMNGNIITATDGITGTIYGIYNYYNDVHSFRNNTIAVKSSTTSSAYGLYIYGSSGVTAYNNSVNNASASASSNYAAYVYMFSAPSGPVNLRNNIFSASGGGVAYYVYDPNTIYSDYNMLYTPGTVLVEGDGNDYATLQEWRNNYDQDINSIVYKPAFTADDNLVPDIAHPDVWAIHGRGVQIADNDHDIRDSARPTTLTAGVPDLGAYEFVPASIPPALPAIPAAAAPGTTQAFMFGTDTVMKVSWAPTSTVPTTMDVRRYSGVVPPGLAPGQQHMYFYTDVDVTPAGPYEYGIQQFYIDPWLGFIPNEPIVKLGRTNTAGEWLVDSTSKVDQLANTISQTGLDSLDKFTGLTDGKASVTPPPTYNSPDSSNRGKQFWVAYGHHYNFDANSQDMVLYLSAQDSANVTVRINGTSWVRYYRIPANTVRVSDIIPKSGLSDARLLDEGLYDRSISITSDVPIVAYAHIYALTNSGASMLLPVGTYGYEYVSLNSSQYYLSGSAGAYSWFYVIADHDSTLVEITPAVTTKLGKPANTPFTVYLNKGQVYNVMGTFNGNQGTDMTGSVVRSLPNAGGKCYPIAVFSGSSRTAICYDNNGDNMIQQVFPSQAWGKKYLAFATASDVGPTSYNSNVFRVMVKDTSTNVSLNGTLLPHSSIVLPGKFYQFNTTSGNGPNGAVYVEADQPVLVAQFMVSSSANLCPGVTTTGNTGDPELIYISPIEQGINKAAFYNTDKNTIDGNYVNVIIANGGFPTLTIDGTATFDDVFPHPFLTGYTCVRKDLGGFAGQHEVKSDSAFTAITYGLGNAESYGYNAGTLVKNLQALASINNVYDTAKAVSDYTCSKTKFRFNILLPIKPTSLTWQLSEVDNLTPNQDVVQNNPVPVDSTMVNGLRYYKYTINAEYTFTEPGTYYVPIYFTHPSFESCNNSRENILEVRVIASPVADFTTNFSGCAGSVIQFNGAGTTSNGVTVNRWNWNFASLDSSQLQNPTYSFMNGGTYDVKLSVIGEDGCVGDTVKQVTVNPAPVVAVVEDSMRVCAGEAAAFEIKDPVSGVTYNWYDAQVGGTVVASGNSFNIANVSGTVSYWVEASANGCTSITRKKVTATVAPVLVAPVVSIDSLAVNLVRFEWTPVTGASGYEVSINSGTTWTPPSSGPTGLTHTVAGLLPLQTVNLIVKALGGCEDVVSIPVNAKTLPDGIYIPNSFTPNGDGLNDVMKVYGYVIKEIHFVVFNQWGEKLFESRNQQQAWDGTFKGKQQPSGVYMYVAKITLNDGTVVDKKGAINLIR